MTLRGQRSSKSSDAWKEDSFVITEEVCKGDVRIVKDKRITETVSAKNVTFTTWKHSRSLYHPQRFDKSIGLARDSYFHRSELPVHPRLTRK